MTTVEPTVSTDTQESPIVTPLDPAPANKSIREVLDPRNWLDSSGGRTIPLLVAMVAMWIYFQVATGGLFFTPGNITDILSRTSLYGIVAIGVVIVLLLGEIDLSLGSLVGLCGCSAAAVMIENISLQFGPFHIGPLDVPALHVAFNYVPTAPPIPKMLFGVGTALLVGVLCGVFTGFCVAVLKIPSFVVTLAGLLAFFGMTLIVTNSQTLGVTEFHFQALGASGDPTIWNRGYLATVWGNSHHVLHLSLGMIAVLIGGLVYTVALIVSVFGRRRAGLPDVQVRSGFVLRVGLRLVQGIVVTGVGLALVEVLDKYQGMSIPVFILIMLLVTFSYVTRRTRFGRHIYATGGNPEAARRAGIPIQRVRWSAFVISGFLAGVVGIIFVAHNNSASGTGVSSDFLLLAIASAVIGGTALVGGRGSVWAALTGALILASVQTGMALTLASNLNQQYLAWIVEAAILLAAVWLDTYIRGRSSSGR